MREKLSVIPSTLFQQSCYNVLKWFSDNSLSPSVKDFVYDSGVPKPCRYFCGRESELTNLHKLLCENGVVFLRGIAGIGKSELAKAYAKEYGKQYTNILYATRCFKIPLPPPFYHAKSILMNTHPWTWRKSLIGKLSCT
jgi:alpha-D-ribose 1-methylphosphonate 5-phosphate C-P lyase